MKYILATKKSYTSARILASHLGMKVTSDPEVILRNSGQLSLRYGCSTYFNDANGVFNTPESIRTVSNSLLFSDFCNKNGFNTPTYTNPLGIDFSKLSFPLLLRKKYHTRGLDIERYDDLEELRRADLRNKFIVPFIDVDSELGVHIINGKVVRIFKKVPVNNDSHPYIRNLDHGYHFKVVRDIENNFRIIQDMLLSLFGLLGLTFGRADVGYSAGKSNYIIWEVNSAPGLNTITVLEYAKEILKLV